MPIVNIDNVGAVGLITDKQPRNLPPEAWSAVSNVRFRNYNAEKITGHEASFYTPTIKPQYLLSTLFGDTYYWYYANGTAIYRSDGIIEQDVTRSAGAYSGGVYSQWNGGVLGGVPIMNNTAMADYPQQWDSSAGLMKDLANWPASTYAKVIRPFKQFLIALNITKSGVNYPYLVKTSHPADPGTVPSSWDETDATKLTIERPLSDTPDHLVDGLALGDIFVIYKQETTWGMQFVGGEFVFRTFKMFKEFGALAQDCIANIPEGHVVVTRGDVVLHNGSTWKSIADDKIRKELFTAISSEYINYVYTVVDKYNNEVWICYPEVGNPMPYATKAKIWNWIDKTWSERDLPNAAFAASGVFRNSGSDVIFDDGSSVTFDADPGVFDQIDYSTIQQRILLADPVNLKFYTADSTNQFDGVNFTSTLERTGLGLVGQDRMGNPKVDLQKVKLIRNVYPKVTADAGVTFNVYVAQQMKQNDVVTWQGPYSFDPASDEKVDCVVSTRLMGVKFESSSNGSWQFHGYGLDLDIIGRY
jgi:hypothetical protein